MGESWIVSPASRRLTLADGSWIVVKDRLNAGEYRAHLRRSSTVGADGRRRIDFMEHAVSQLVAYLLDWSAEDVPIRGVSEADLRVALDAIDPERFAELNRALDAHVAAIAAEDAKKKTPMTTGDAAISPSPSGVAGASSGSVN